MNSDLSKLKAASSISRIVPLPLLLRLGYWAGWAVGPQLSTVKANQLAQHLERITGGSVSGRSAIRRGFGSYGRYWAESLRLPYLDQATLNDRFEVDGLDRIENVLLSGIGPILVLPHIGGWEWAAAWLTQYKRWPVSAVVERLEPDAVFEWFSDLRSSYGINVIPVGAGSMAKLVKQTNAGDIICLLADRDVAGTGVEVEFFGEKTSLPVGPALLSRRTGAPLLPTAVYYDGWRVRAEVREPIYPTWGGSLREDLIAVTEEVTQHLEELISKAPDQWHVLGPNWPSDRTTVAMREG